LEEARTLSKFRQASSRQPARCANVSK
jgi:hypothetical protein